MGRLQDFWRKPIGKFVLISVIIITIIILLTIIIAPPLSMYNDGLLQPELVKVDGNNGTVSCSEYCGRNINTQLPTKWTSARCNAVYNSAGVLVPVDCDNAPNVAVSCECARRNVLMKTKPIFSEYK